MAARKKTLNKARIFQYLTRIGILVFVTCMAVGHQLDKSGTPNVHAFCPFGGLEALYKLLASGEYMQKIFPSAAILLGGTVLLTLVLNRAFCGWICPLGTLQAIMDKIARFFKIKRVQVPSSIDRNLSYIKYLILLMILYFTWQSGTLVYEYYDPWAAYAHLASGWSELYSKFLIGVLFLTAAVVGSIWIPHNFCRYFCPMGAFLSLLAKVSPTKLHRTQETCVSCQKCDRVCPVQIEICSQPTVSSSQCLSCGDCTSACPKTGCLEYRIGGKFPLRWAVYGMLALALFFIPVGLAKQVGAWKTMTSTRELLIDETGALNPYYIKGSMSLESVAKEFHVQPESFFRYFNLPGDLDATAQLKEIATAHNLRMRHFKDFFAEHGQRE